MGQTNVSASRADVEAELFCSQPESQVFGNAAAIWLISSVSAKQKAAWEGLDSLAHSA